MPVSMGVCLLQPSVGYFTSAVTTRTACQVKYTDQSYDVVVCGFLFIIGMYFIREYRELMHG